jgi:D-tyrosyl-tRNA(Tyr) deacylase
LIGDKQIDIKKTVDKISNLRIFDDEKGKMNLSILDTKGSLLVVSQFTLCGDIKKGRRPSFMNAESPKLSLKIYENLMEDFRQLGIKTLGGVFGEIMKVELVNEGPATFIINSKEL